MLLLTKLTADHPRKWRCTWSKSTMDGVGISRSLEGLLFSGTLNPAPIYLEMGNFHVKRTNLEITVPISNTAGEGPQTCSLHDCWIFLTKLEAKAPSSIPSRHFWLCFLILKSQLHPIPLPIYFGFYARIFYASDISMYFTTGSN